MRASEMTDEEDAGFDLDLTGEPDGEPQGTLSQPEESGATDNSLWLLDQVLAPYGAESVDKAQDLLRNRKVSLVKREGQHAWYEVKGSRLYVVRTIRSLDTGEVVVECSCPNGAKGAEGNCYHLIAVKVIEEGLGATLVPGFELPEAPKPKLAEGGMVTPPAISIVAPARAEDPVDMVMERDLVDGLWARQRITMFRSGTIGIELLLPAPDEQSSAYWSQLVKISPNLVAKKTNNEGSGDGRREGQ